MGYLQCVISKNQQMQMAPWALQLGMFSSPPRCHVSSGIYAIQRGPGARWNAQVGETQADWHRVDTCVLAPLGLFLLLYAFISLAFCS